MASPPDPDRLTVRGLTRSFGPVRVLDAVDLRVAPGEAVLLSGSNGSGKTTLLRCIAGLARHSGEILLDGWPCGRSVTSRAGLGYLPQAPGFPAWATGREVLDLFAQLRGRMRNPADVPDGFLPPLDRPVRQLSGGMRQRIAIAAALLGEPRLLLLDEPEANLDEDGRAGLAAIVSSVGTRGVSVLFATPSPDDLAGLADRTIRLIDGRLAAGVSIEATPAGTDADQATVHRLDARKAAG